MLENFRSQKIIWDRANKKIFEKIEANSGDSNGRKLVVQVINQEATEVLSGTTLSLGWKSRQGAKGLDAFNIVDTSKGIFEIYYTTEMLSNIGNIEASLILIDSTSRIESSTFTISVRQSTVDDESVESENSFTALTEALVRVNDFDAQLAQKVGQGKKAELEDLSPTVLSAIEGGEGTSFNLLSIPQNDSVTPEKIQDESIRLDKINKETKELIGIVDGYGVVKHNEIGSDEVPTNTPSINMTRIIFPAVEKSGYVKRIKAFAHNADTFVIKTFKRLENGQYKTLERYPIYLNAGQNDVKVDIRINVGEYIGYYCKDSTIRTSSKSGYYAAYAQGDVDEGTFTTTSQRVFFEASIEYLTKFEKMDGHIEPTEIKGVGKVEPSVNLFDKEAVISGGYFSTTTGEWILSGSYVSSDFIPVSIGRYRKSNVAGFVLWDKDKKYIRGASAGHVPILDSDIERDVAFVTLSVLVSDIDTFMFTKEDEYPEEYIPHIKEEYYFSDKWNVSNTNNQESVIANKIDVNMKPLHIPDPFGYNQPFHPSVLHIEEGFGGHKWWMIQTPFPQYSKTRRDRYECPVILASNDGVNWFYPEGITNPLDDIPMPEEIPGNNKWGDYYSDVHLVYREDLGRLEAWYRASRNDDTLYEGFSLPTFILRRTSTDGVEWSDLEVMVNLQEDISGLGDMVRSQALWYENGKYRMWFVDKLPNVSPRMVVYAESTDGLIWTNRTECNVPSSVPIWHIDMFYHDNTYHLLNYSGMQSDKLDYFTSEDGINFEFVKRVLEPSGVDNSIFKDGLYRSCLTHDGKEYYLYFNGENDDRRLARIGLLKGESVENLYSVDGGQEEGYVEFTNGIAIHNDDVRNDSYIELTAKGTRIGVEYDTERVFVEKSDGTKIYLND